MPRSPMLGKGAGALLQDLSLAALMAYLPRQDVKRALADTQSDSIRQRLLPSEVVAYLVVMLALYADASVRENLRILLEPLRGRFGVSALGVPTGGAITKARQRLGAAPFIRLFEALARPAADSGSLLQGLSRGGRRRHDGRGSGYPSQSIPLRHSRQPAR